MIIHKDANTILIEPGDNAEDVYQELAKLKDRKAYTVAYFTDLYIDDLGSWGVTFG